MTNDDEHDRRSTREGSGEAQPGDRVTTTPPCPSEHKLAETEPEDLCEAADDVLPAGREGPDGGAQGFRLGQVSPGILLVRVSAAGATPGTMFELAPSGLRSAGVLVVNGEGSRVIVRVDLVMRDT